MTVTLTHYCGIAENFSIIYRMRMKSRFFFFAIPLFVVTTVLADHHEKKEDGFTALNLSNMKTEGNWQAMDDGVLYLEPREGEEGWKRYHHYLWTKEKYGDFTFSFEYKYGEGGNSGFYFRCVDQKDPVEGGFEVQILDSMGKPDGEMGHHDNGGVIKTKGADTNASIPAGEWNKMVVTMKGSHLTVMLNGKKVQDFDLAEKKPEDKPLESEGYIAIQDHGLPFWVRNLKVKAL